MRAVFPDPTGLLQLVSASASIGTFKKGIPSDANCEGPVSPVTAFVQRLFAVDVGTRAVEDFVRVAMVGDIVVGVRVRVRHDSQLGTALIAIIRRGCVVWCGVVRCGAVRGED